MRHGVMIVGSTLSGKTTIINTLEETLKRSRENEIQEKTIMYKHQKAKLMGKKHGKKLKNMKQGNNGAIDEIKLTPDDLKIIKAKCKNEGVETFYINPKSITIDQLMGNFDETSHDWVDGILAYLMRECSIDTSNKRKWIVFDGPIDPIWVENLNSVLDDNKKLTLNTGETIKLSPSMNILIEAENLSSCTPATISRCGMIYMQEEQISNKGLFNKWLKSLPDTIEENLFEIENMCHWFFPEVLNLMKPNNMIYSCSQKWLILNFTRLFDSLIFDYYKEELYNNPNQETYNLFGGQKDTNLKLSTFDKSKKIPLMSFADVESRFLNSVNYKNLWIEAFFIFSLVWTFGYILKPHVLKEFNRLIKRKISGNVDQIATVAQLRSKLKNDHNMKRYQEFEPSPHFKELPRPPYFLLPFPQEYSVFDVVFDLETNSWTTWESVKDEFPKSIENEMKKKSGYYNAFIQSEESIKYSYIISANILSNKSILLIGPTGCGKSWLARDVCFNYVPQISQKFRFASVSFSHNTDAKKAKNFFDSRLDKRRKNVYGPPFGINYVFYIDDLMMPATDEYGVKSANELIRQWFDYGGWYDHIAPEHRKIEDIQFVGCITTYENHKNVMSNRNEWHWSFLGIQPNDKMYSENLSQIIDMITINWAGSLHTALTSTIRASIDILHIIEKNIKPTPAKFLNVFNPRHLYKVIYGLAD